MASTLETLAVRLVSDSADFTKGMADAESKMDSFANKAKGIGSSLTVGVTLPLVALGATATKFATDLNADMANVASLGLLPERVLELKGNVQEMAISVGKGTSDLADGLYQVVSAFGDTADTATILEINAKAAAAGLATTTDAINLTSAVTKGYGDTSAAAVQQVSDLAFTAVRLGQTTFPELAGAMGKVVPLANELGISQEELFAVMATGTGVTGTASEVVTQMRGTLQSLMAPTATMTQLIADQGFASGKAMLEQLGYQGSMAAIVKAAEESGTPLAKYMGSIEGQTIALALAGSQSEVYQEKLAEMGVASGASEAAFIAQTEGINASGFAMAQAAIQGQVLMQKLGDGLAPAISKVFELASPWIDKLIEMADWFANTDAETQGWIVGLVALVAAAGPVISIIGTVIGVVSGAAGLIGAITGSTAVVGVLGAALTVLTGPIGIIVAAVAALALAWSTDFLGIKTATLGAIDGIKAEWPGWLSGMQTGWSTFTTGLTQGAQSMWQTVSGAWTQHTSNLSAITQTHMGTISQVWQTQTQFIQGLASAGMQFITGDWQGGLNTLSETTQRLLDDLGRIFQTQLDQIGNLFNLFGWGEMGRNIMEGIANGIRNAAGLIADAAQRAAEDAYNRAKAWLGIGSPSKLAEKELGVPFAQGFALGIEGQMDNVSRSIGDALGGLMTDMEPRVAVAGAGGGLSGATINVYLNGNGDYESGRQVGKGILAELRAAGLT